MVQRQLLLDDKVIFKGLTYDTESKSGPGDDGSNLNAFTPLSLLSSTGGILGVTLPDGTVDGQSKRILITGYSSALTITVTSASWKSGNEGTITFSAAAEFVNLVWANSSWWPMGSPASVSYS